MAQVSDVITFSRTQAQTDSNGLTNANGLIWTNEALVDFRRRLQTDGIDASQLQEAYTDLDANVGTYLYPSDLAWLKAIEVNYTTSNPEDYKTSQQVDVANLPSGTSFSWLRLNQPTNVPQFNDMGDWFEVFPTPVADNTQGIRIWYFKTPTEYASVSSDIGYPETLDYRILGWRVAASYYKSLNKFDEAVFFEGEYEKRVKDLISTLGRGTQQPLTATGLQMTGWNF